jgi:D-amino peptidase
MKFFIAVDCEGVACGVGSSGQSLSASPNFAFACRQATREANAAARALFENGATQVIVWDNHNGSLNLDYEAIDERCDILLGTGLEHRFQTIDASFTGILFIGYHSRDNVIDAPLAHTYSSTAVQSLKVNGVEVGEMAIDAAVAGTFGVPPLFVASDDKAVAEAGQFFPGIQTVTTKVGLSWSAALSKHPKRVEAEIYEGVKRAITHRATMQPFAFESPLTLEMRFKRIDAADAAARSKSGWTRVDAHTVSRTVDSILDLY